MEGVRFLGELAGGESRSAMLGDMGGFVEEKERFSTLRPMFRPGELDPQRPGERAPPAVAAPSTNPSQLLLSAMPLCASALGSYSSVSPAFCAVNGRVAGQRGCRLVGGGAQTIRSFPISASAELRAHLSAFIGLARGARPQSLIFPKCAFLEGSISTRAKYL